MQNLSGEKSAFLKVKKIGIKDPKDNSIYLHKSQYIYNRFYEIPDLLLNEKSFRFSFQVQESL